jgi:hypothetical protein
MSRTDQRVTAGQLTTRILGFISLLLLSGILYAGLKPFHSPANEVTWVAKANALRFGEYGTILSSGSFPPIASGGADHSLEIWMKPGLAEDSNTFLAFYSPGEPRQLSLHQADRDLELRIESSAAWRHEKAARINIDDAFRDRKSAFWAVTSGPSGTAIYRDDARVKESSGLRISGREFSGRLIIGSSPIFNENWSGVLRGLAIYNRALTAAQISRHYQTWMKGAGPDIGADDACIALYLFDEHSGRIVHNKVGLGNDLYIPAKYMILDQTLLDPVWRAFNWSRGFWKDALINVGGFIPVGFFFCAYLTARGFRRPALTASALGGAISLFIELVQSRLPTRDSSMSDVITNIAGSIIGASLYRGTVARILDSCIAWMIQSKTDKLRIIS